MQAVKRLHDLQEIDLRVDELQEALAEVRASLTDDSAITSTTAQVEEMDTQLRDVGARRRAVERTIEQVQEKLQNIESRLYGGEVTSTRELSAADEERSFVVQQVREEEDNLLELMVETEDLETGRREAREALEKLETDRPAEQAELRSSEQRLSGELDELGRQRSLIVPELPADLLTLYDSLLKTTNRRPVARVERGMCQGCRITLSTMELQRAKSAQSGVRCSSCRRILYLV